MNIAHQAMFNSFKNKDPHTEGVYQMLDQMYPAFRKKVFEGSGFIGWLVRSGYDATDVLEYPICGRCESLAALDGYALKDGRYVNRCSCMKCGHTTINPVSFREWIADELRHKAPQKFLEQLDDALDFAVDITAQQMMAKAEHELKQMMGMESAKNKGLIMPDGTFRSVDEQRAKINVRPVGLSDDVFKKSLED